MCVEVAGVATIRLDKPDRNVDMRVATELHAAALDVSRRDDIRAVVVWGGERIFSAANTGSVPCCA